MSTYIAIIIAAVLTNNFVLSKFYGCCPFLGVSKKLDSSVGMGAVRGFRHVVRIPVYLSHLLFILKPLELTLPPDSGIYPGHCRICTAAGNGHQKADAAAV